MSSIIVLFCQAKAESKTHSLMLLSILLSLKHKYKMEDGQQFQNFCYIEMHWFKDTYSPENKQ